MNISREVERYIETITTKFPTIQSFWLIGSRANGTARVDSDWDILIFADQEVLAGLRQYAVLRRGKIDTLVVVDGDNFEEPWPRSDKPKNGNLTSWEWKIISSNEATYKTLDCYYKNKFMGTPRSGKNSWLKAKKLWPL